MPDLVGNEQVFHHIARSAGHNAERLEQLSRHVDKLEHAISDAVGGSGTRADQQMTHLLRAASGDMHKAAATFRQAKEAASTAAQEARQRSSAAKARR